MLIMWHKIAPKNTNAVVSLQFTDFVSSRGHDWALPYILVAFDIVLFWYHSGTTFWDPRPGALKIISQCGSHRKCNMSSIPHSELYWLQHFYHYYWSRTRFDHLSRRKAVCPCHLYTSNSSEWRLEPADSLPGRLQLDKLLPSNHLIIHQPYDRTYAKNVLMLSNVRRL